MMFAKMGVVALMVFGCREHARCFCGENVPAADAGNGAMGAVIDDPEYEVSTDGGLFRGPDSGDDAGSPTVLSGD